MAKETTAQAAPTAQQPLCLEVALVEQPELLRVTTIKRGILDQLPQYEDAHIPNNVQVVGFAAPAWVVIRLEGGHLGRVHVQDWTDHLMAPARATGQAGLWTTAAKAANAAINSYPQIFQV